MKTTKKHYSSSVKAKVIEAYNNGEMSCKDLAEEYGVSSQAINNWIRRYKKHGSRGLERTRNVYKISTKKRLDICRRYAEEDITLKALGAEIGISGELLSSWVKKFESEGKIDLTARLKAKEDAKKLAIQLSEDWQSSGLILSEFCKERNIDSSSETFRNAMAVKNIDGHTIRQFNERVMTDRYRELFRRVSEDGKSMADVANSAGITLSYLRQRFVELRKKGMIETPANCAFEKVGLVRKVQAILRDAAEEGKSVREAAADRGVSEQTIFYWRKKIIDAGEAESIAPKEYKTDAVSVTASEKEREHKFPPVNTGDAKKIAEIDCKTAAPQEDEQIQVKTVKVKAKTLDVRRMAKLTLPSGAVIEAEMTMREARELLAG